MGSASRVHRTAARGEDDLFFRALDASADAVALTRLSDTAFVYVNRSFLDLSAQWLFAAQQSPDPREAQDVAGF